jgi:glutamine amidotransferase
LLFDESEEFGRHRGLGIIPGGVRRFEVPGLHVPHVGWNQIQEVRTDPMLEGVPEGAYFYFVHSYYAEPEDTGDQLARTEYGHPFCSIARRGTVWGAQFHPEKSQAMGQRLLGNFIRIGC